MPEIVLKALEEFARAMRAIFDAIMWLLLMPFRLIGAVTHRPSPLQIAAEALAEQAPAPTGPRFDEIPPTYEQRRGRERHPLAEQIRKTAENRLLGFPRHAVERLPPILEAWVCTTCTRDDALALISAADWRIHDHVKSAGDDRRGYKGWPAIPAMHADFQREGRSGKGGPARPEMMTVDQLIARLDADAPSFSGPRMR
ncbi:MAG: hypothetical protein MIL41_05025 [Hyphomicrobiales bacterium]|jgi:hypothetical protein